MVAGVRTETPAMQQFASTAASQAHELVGLVQSMGSQVQADMASHQGAMRAPFFNNIEQHAQQAQKLSNLLDQIATGVKTGANNYDSGDADNASAQHKAGGGISGISIPALHGR